MGRRSGPEWHRVGQGPASKLERQRHHRPLPGAASARRSTRAATRSCSTARWSPSTRRAVRASAGCNSACISPTRRRCACARDRADHVRRVRPAASRRQRRDAAAVPRPPASADGARSRRRMLDRARRTASATAQTLLDAVRARGLEGIVAKKVDSPYLPGKRSSSWIKVKVRLRQEFVIGGWQPGEGGREGQLGSLLVGVYDNGALRYCGKVGTGFTMRARAPRRDPRAARDRRITVRSAAASTDRPRRPLGAARARRRGRVRRVDVRGNPASSVLPRVAG